MGQFADKVPNFTMRFTKDPLTLKHLDFSKLQKPNIRNLTNFAKASRAPHPSMDKISIHQNMFIEL